jgi:hypothetical protein
MGRFQLVFANMASLVDSTTFFQLIFSVPLIVVPPSPRPQPLRIVGDVVDTLSWAMSTWGARLL